eukprot:6191931-Pleurochrysis_carterae.AAC.5
MALGGSTLSVGCGVLPTHAVWICVDCEGDADGGRVGSGRRHDAQAGACDRAGEHIPHDHVRVPPAACPRGLCPHVASLTCPPA